MKISYPLRDTNGKELCALDDVMRLIDGEAHGTWLLGANGLWHGGIHISDVSNPFSALKPDAVNTEEPLPLQFMADGTVVAYRINNEYLTAPYCGQQLRYSSSFVLVKSQCKPDPQKEKSWLEFYSLYMHLAPVADYPKSPCYKVRDGHSGILLRQYKNGQYGLPEGEPDNGEAGTYPAPAKTKKSLSAGDRFVSSRTGRFYVTKNGNATLTTFGLVRLLKDSVPGKEQYWVTLDPVLVEPDGEIQGLMPEWMQKAKQKGAFDAVELTEGTEEWKVSAGTPVGFMGCTESPGEGNQFVDREWFVHLEVLSTDSRMPGFLANPACVKGEKRSVLAPKGKSLFTRQDAAGQPVFTPTSARLGAQCLLSRELATPVADESQKWWYKVSGSGWLPQNDVEEVNQYDLEKLGFQALEESSGGDVMNSPYESWIPQAFGTISRTAEQGAGYQYGLVPQFYRDLMAGMDSNRDGKVTAEEIRQALAVRDPLVKNVVNRLVVKHHSEWYGGRSTGRWEGFYKDLDSLEVKYCEKWQADLEWMSKVPPFDKDEAVWHFHPVIFLSTLQSVSHGPLWMSVAINEYKKFKDLIETDPELDNQIKQYHQTTNVAGSDHSVSWCSSFVNWIMIQAGYAELVTRSALAYSWNAGAWKNGEEVDKPFYGAIAVMNYSHVGFVYGKNSQGSILILGGNQGGGRIGTANCISIRANALSSIRYIMKPKGYVVPKEDFDLHVYYINGVTPTYEDSH
nr:CHAP domain-containing protein [Klebsiella variicola]